MLTGEIMMYDWNDPDSIQVPETCSQNCREFLAACLEYDPTKRATINDIVTHKFLSIEEKTYQESHEAINFMSLYGLVAAAENPEPKKHNESVERLSILQKRSKYQSRDSVLSSYKVTPELSKALGLDQNNDRKASLRHINLGKHLMDIRLSLSKMAYLYLYRHGISEEI